MEVVFEFFVGGGNFTTAHVLSDFRFLLYDVDGSSDQSESYRVSMADGFTGYQVLEGSNVSVVDEGNGEFVFNGSGVNGSETSLENSVIAYFSDVSSIKITSEVNTSGQPGRRGDGVFTGFDGDLSLIGDQPDPFTPIASVPEPSSTALLGLGALGLLIRRKR